MKHRFWILLAICISTACGFAVAQQNLQRRVSVNVRNQKIADLLKSIGKQGCFYFSYTSNWVAVDSAVTITENYVPIRQLLDRLFEGKVDYKETPGYIILRPAPYRLAVFPDNNADEDKNYIITGYVTDERTGYKLSGASVYEHHVLLSTLTDKNGYFKLKIKYNGPVTLTVTKELYKDTSINILGAVRITNDPHRQYYSTDTSFRSMEKSWLGRMFISSRQRLQSLNIGNFIATVPVQTSITPGLSSHGLMSSQIVNSLSLNLIGGYTAGVNGVELAGMFNINRQDVKYVQAAGLFNLTSGTMVGVQLSGLSNTVFKSVNGVQAAGLNNSIKDSLKGVQMAGLFNFVNGTAKGAQAAGLVNVVGNTSEVIQFAGSLNINNSHSAGMQVAGVGNITRGTAKGVQVAGLFNYAHRLSGTHFGLLNLADTLDGVAIGLVNLSRNGYHQFAVYTDEVCNTNISFKSGNSLLYTRIMAGRNLGPEQDLVMFGAAFGHDFILGKSAMIGAEGAFQTLFFSDYQEHRYLNKISLYYHHRINRWVGLFAGPSYAVYTNNQNDFNDSKLLNHKLAFANFSDRTKGWLGWSIGVTIL
ncbi:carboxypeptidase-like regulatory domain-containing protein [Mucilaginibacter sp. Bleaf8]|uniref:carboxypeptidase-like regulatory domain-containing protein n=1 Tax=Mucilaginibacter sp. Bleaf8 TaxID=2834430 RepID=UPI001BCCD1B0|nr:carboxypeptidase-like regulatory domain-containing protein [Mucilaginibacter sp. Bleaf8]MBS7563735.1 carboxypeptidase-like regulatory domain-containing protein [Mucilaginibacter sp. Bleaf8]